MNTLLAHEETPVSEQDLEQMAIPWWLKAAGVIGVPSAIACYLVYSMVSGIVPGVMRQNDNLVQLQATMNSVLQQLIQVQAEHQKQTLQSDRVFAVLQASCVNAAKTVEERERCFRYSRSVER